VTVYRAVQHPSPIKIEDPLTPADARPHATPTEWAFVERYLQPNDVADVLDGFIGADMEGSALLCVYFRDEVDLGHRERVTMQRLTR
jgi:hypothetical protein